MPVYWENIYTLTVNTNRTRDSLSRLEERRLFSAVYRKLSTNPKQFFVVRRDGTEVIDDNAPEIARVTVTAGGVEEGPRQHRVHVHYVIGYSQISGSSVRLDFVGIRAALTAVMLQTIGTTGHIFIGGPYSNEAENATAYARKGPARPGTVRQAAELISGWEDLPYENQAQYVRNALGDVRQAGVVCALNLCSTFRDL